MTTLAIIGYGNIGRVHHDNLRSLRGCRVAGIYDARPLPGVTYPSLDAVLADPAVDAVVVATPSETHASISIQALAAGKHVFVEKPLAGTLEDARLLVAAASRYPALIVQTGFCERFNVNYLEARRAVREGLLGEVRSIQTTRRAPYTFSDPTWALGVLDTSVHNLDLILWLKGIPPVSVHARGVQVYPDSAIPHAVTTTLTFPDGAVAVDHIAWVKDDAYPLHQCARSQMFIQGSQGFFEIDLTDRPSAIHTQNAYRMVDSVIIGGPEYPGCLKLQFEAFLSAIEESTPVLAPLADALLTEQVVIAAAQSLRSGEEVPFVA